MFETCRIRLCALCNVFRIIRRKVFDFEDGIAEVEKNGREFYINTKREGVEYDNE